MKKYLRIVALLLALITCFSLISCVHFRGGDEEEEGNEKEAPKKEVVYIVTEEQWNQMKGKMNYTFDIKTHSNNGSSLFTSGTFKHTEKLICKCDFKILENDNNLGESPSEDSVESTAITSSNNTYNSSNWWDAGSDYSSGGNTNESDLLEGNDISSLHGGDYGTDHSHSGSLNPNINQDIVLPSMTIGLCVVEYEGKWYRFYEKELAGEHIVSWTEVDTKEYYDLYFPCEFSSLTYEENIKAYSYYDKENNNKYFFFFENGLLVKDVKITGCSSYKSVEPLESDFTYSDIYEAYSTVRLFKDFDSTAVSEEKVDHLFDPSLIKNSN